MDIPFYFIMDISLISLFSKTVFTEVQEIWFCHLQLIVIVFLLFFYNHWDILF